MAAASLRAVRRIEPAYDLVYVYLTNVFPENRAARLTLNTRLAQL